MVVVVAGKGKINNVGGPFYINLQI